MSKIETRLAKFSELTPASCEAQFDAAAQTYLAALKNLETVPATVKDFLEPLDQISAAFSEAIAVPFHMTSIGAGVDYEPLLAVLSNKYTELEAQLRTNRALFEKFVELEKQELDEESATLVATELLQFRLGGIDLSPEKQAELTALDLKIADLATQYQQKVSKQLATEFVINGKTYAPNNFTLQAALEEITDPSERRQLLELSLARGFGADPATDTRQLVLDIVAARYQRAKLLGFNTHAEAVLATETAPSVAAAQQLLSQVGVAALEKLAVEAESYAKMAKADGVENFSTADWSYYETKTKEASLGLSNEALKPYLELWKVLEDGVFYAANRLFGLTATLRPELKGWHPTCRVYEINEETGKSLGLFIIDPYARPGKNGGAWMNSLLQGHSATDHESIIINCCNYTPVAEGEKKYLTWDEVETLFHEFGHALHGFLSKTKYSLTAGTNVPRDFVELPSQLNEMWAYHPQVIANFARHAETGEVIPAEMLEQLQKSKTFGQAYVTVEFCASALLDQLWHTADPAQITSVEEFEAEALKRSGVYSELVPPRYRSTYFPHAFTVGYDAGYYSYMWAETLVAECEAWFRNEVAQNEDGGFNRAAGKRLEAEILSKGYSRKPNDSFIALIGHEARAETILTRRGL
ncbi:M3 family metallopeptidase [Gleimia sp. 6138-11-ORH1]|uniref:M3 family metallopeptidase n=1 Tax=Gleimia sp. 6138-11-ORH1 TaxID=2973937 RepID=UPI002167682D|nr:M3 family metallopeptidase [Gleimia sp. 6138-11-ORH1]MCS4484281.1 M3 family metallopeptidase [Gleimia sp. 6138-11-ORH1]